MEVVDSVHGFVVQIFPTEATGNLPDVGQQGLHPWKCWGACEVCDWAARQQNNLFTSLRCLKASCHERWHHPVFLAARGPWRCWGRPLRAAADSASLRSSPARLPLIINVCFWLLQEMVRSVPCCFNELSVTSQFFACFKTHRFHTFFNSNVFTT